MNNPFYGRESEVKWLVDAFDAVATRDKDGKFTGPKILAVLSESGLGKSRLVQELYCRIAESEDYNPAAFNYWPKQFGDSSLNLNVSPQMENQSAKGPPKFLWLGARWKATDERNSLNRESVFPEIKEELVIHDAIMRINNTAWCDFWSRAKDTVKSDFSGEVSGQITGDLINYAVGVSVPFAGLLTGILKIGLDVAAERNEPIEPYALHKSSQKSDEVEEMLSIFSKLLGDKHSVPVVLWLDDAHWADYRMQSFIRQLAPRAKAGKWPLLIIFTHWEREYKEQIKSGPSTISSMIGDLPENDRLFLKKIEINFFEAYLKQKLSGLTTSQVELLCEKADGNFLTMIENVGHLLSQPRYFINKTPESALNEVGVEEVLTYESDRKKRVQQRFDSLTPDVLQDVLALGADQGVRFIPEIIVKYLEDEAGQQERFNSDIDQCIDPFAILSRLESSSVLREFRDKLYVDASRRFFEKFYRNDKREKWNGVIKTWLADQVMKCFDESGNLLTNAGNENLYFLNGSRQEQHALIELGKDKFDLRESSLLALRFVCLAVRALEADRSWSKIYELAKILEDWASVDLYIGTGISIEMLENIRDNFAVSGAYSSALNLARVVYDYYMNLAKEQGTPESQHNVSASLNNIADIEKVLGQLPQALLKYQQSLEIRQQLAEELGTPESRRDVGASLNNLANLEKALGQLPQAMLKHQQSLEIFQQLAEELGTPQSRRDVSASLNNLAIIERALGQLPQALLKYQQSLEIRQQLAEELGTPQSRRDVSISLNKIAGIEKALGQLPQALLKFQQSLEIRQRLAEELGTPESRRDVSVSLNNIACIERELGQLPQALLKFQQSLAIDQQLAEELGTPQSRRDVRITLESIVDIEQAQGNIHDAEKVICQAREWAIVFDPSYVEDIERMHKELIAKILSSE